MELALETVGLRKRFGDFVAVDGIDVQVPKGSFYGFLGPNGAGKSTTIRCLTGLLAADGGSMRILGFDAATEGLEIRRRVGVVPEDLALFDHLTAAEHLRFVGRLHGLDAATVEGRAAELLRLMGLEGDAGELAVDFSHGMKKKLALAVALLPAPRLLFLDEPFEGLDALASRQIRRLLQDFVASGGTVFVTSHILEIVERLCDHLGVLHRGRLVAQGPLAELRAGAGGSPSLEDLFLSLVGEAERPTEALSWLRA